MGIFTSKATGNWSASGQTTWNETGVPGNGDTVTNSHAITVDVNTTIGQSGPGLPAAHSLATVSGGGALAAGLYTVRYSNVDSSGMEGTSSVSVTSASISANDTIRVTLPALPTGVVSRRIYVGAASLSWALRLYATGITATTYDCTSASWTDGTTTYANAAVWTGYAVKVTGSGSLTVAEGKALTVRGDVFLDNTLLTLAAGATLTFDGSAAVVPAAAFYELKIGLYNSQSAARLVCNGTSGSRCSVNSNASSVNARLNGDLQRGGQVVATFTDFLRLGSATVAWANPWIMSSGDTFTLDDCTVTSCGHFDQHGAHTNTTFRWQRVRVVSQLSTTSMALYFAGTPGTGQRLIDSCDIPVNIAGVVGGVTITNNLLSRFSPSGTGTWNIDNPVGLWQHNLQLLTQYTGIAETMNDSYLLFTTAADNPHFIATTYSSGLTVTGCIFDGPDLAPATDGGDCILVPNSAGTVTAKKCIVLPIKNGASAGTAVGTLITALGGANVHIVAEHNTYHSWTDGGGGLSGGVRVGESYNTVAGTVTSLKSNIAWDTSSRGYLFYNLAGATQITDTCAPANADYNAGWYVRTTGTYDGFDNGYNAKFSTSPGVHDITVNTQDPQFVDAARNFCTWGLSQGTDGTVAATLTWLHAQPLANNPALIQGLVAYVRAGFRPQNTLYRTAGHDGTVLGAIASAGDIPSIASAATNTAGTAITVTFTEIDSPILPASGATGFSLTGTTATIASIAISDVTATLTLSGAIWQRDTVKLNYTPGNVTDIDSLAMVALSNFSVTNNSTVVDTVAPIVASAITNSAGTTITVIFTEADSSPILPASGATGFSLTGTSATIASVAISGTTAILTLSGTIGIWEDVKLNYTPGNVTDSSSLALAAVSNYPVVSLKGNRWSYNVCWGQYG